MVDQFLERCSNVAEMCAEWTQMPMGKTKRNGPEMGPNWNRMGPESDMARRTNTYRYAQTKTSTCVQLKTNLGQRLVTQTQKRVDKKQVRTSLRLSQAHLASSFVLVRIQGFGRLQGHGLLLLG